MLFGRHRRSRKASATSDDVTGSSEHTITEDVLRGSFEVPSRASEISHAASKAIELLTSEPSVLMEEIRAAFTSGFAAAAPPNPQETKTRIEDVPLKQSSEKASSRTSPTYLQYGEKTS